MEKKQGSERIIASFHYEEQNSECLLDIWKTKPKKKNYTLHLSRTFFLLHWKQPFDLLVIFFHFPTLKAARA